MRLLTHIAAIIPAAGLSSRMKDFKPLLPLGHTNILVSSISLFQTCGIKDIFVITGHRSEEIEKIALAHHAVPIYNPGFREGMFSSILTGIRHLKQKCEAFFILPVDMPIIRPYTVKEILAAYKTGKGEIIYPFFDGKRGHPPLISSKYIPKILDWKQDGGLRACLKQFEGHAGHVTVCDEGIHMDADTPEDYRKIVKKTETRDMPATRECLCLLKQIRKLDAAIVDHCIKTAETAALICKSLDMTSAGINSELVIKAALLHDMARNGRNHARLGSEILKGMGFENIADIIRDHMDIITRPDHPLDEKEIVYFADKLTVNNTVEADFENRFKEKLKAHAGNIEAENAIKKRLTAAKIIHHKIEHATGKIISDILKTID